MTTTQLSGPQQRVLTAVVTHDGPNPGAYGGPGCRLSGLDRRSADALVRRGLLTQVRAGRNHSWYAPTNAGRTAHTHTTPER